MTIDQTQFPCAPRSIKPEQISEDLIPDPDNQDAAALVIEACVKAGEWRSFSIEELLATMPRGEVALRQSMAIACERLSSKGFVELRRNLEKVFILTPLPKLAELLK